MRCKLPKFLLALVLVLLTTVGLMPKRPVQEAEARAYVSQNATEDARILHVLNRLGYGPRPGDLEKVRAMGVDRYISQQLHPERILESPQLQDRLAKIETTRMPPLKLFQQYGPQRFVNGRKNASAEDIKKAVQESNAVLLDAAESRIYRAMESERQLQEVMTEFWFNHFNVYGRKGLDTIWVGAYEEQAIRPHAMGKFRDLLGATAHHPAMLFYLDNWQNTAENANRKNKRFGGLNENYARELMELHTLGVDGGYTQQDVVALAKILTGWGYPRGRDQERGNFRQNAGNLKALLNGNGFFFDETRHDYSTKRFLGATIAGTGKQEGDQALDMLARHPSTARHVSAKLAQYFVSDIPPPALVDRLARRFMETDGDIRLVLDTLFSSPEFWAAESRQAKFKDPYRYVISSIRASGQSVTDVRILVLTLMQLGMPLYGCETPNGYKYTRDAWLNPDAMTRRLSFATAYAGGYIPTSAGKKQPMSAQTIANAIGNDFSPNTVEALNSAPPQLQASMILGSPEFMRY